MLGLRLRPKAEKKEALGRDLHEKTFVLYKAIDRDRQSVGEYTNFVPKIYFRFAKTLSTFIYWNGNQPPNK